MVECSNPGHSTPCDDQSLACREESNFRLTYNNGKAIQEIPNRYLDESRNDLEAYQSLELGEDRQTRKDIAYIKGLARLFD